jgi:histidinol dehydrogenase
MKTIQIHVFSPGLIQSHFQQTTGYESPILNRVQEIIQHVKQDGDKALFHYTKQFDKVTLDSIRIPPDQLEQAIEEVSPVFLDALDHAYKNIYEFHQTQIPSYPSKKEIRGNHCWLTWKPIDRVGLYIPGGTAPLVSTILMLGIPAVLAGCKTRILCTPPGKSGIILPELLVAAKRVGITDIFCVGGAQAIAAMAVGTESVPEMDKLFGPGNRYVAAAKALVSLPPFNKGIDMLAGPSELAVFADESANPEWVAADLLSQAEHGMDSPVVLVSDSATLISDVIQAIQKQIPYLDRKDFLNQSITHSIAIQVSDLDLGMDLINDYAPEHLIMVGKKAERYVDQVHHAGSVFVGPYASVVFGDYASGTNHTLPTSGTAKSMGTLSMYDFLKPVAFQEITPEGFKRVGTVVKTLAEVEHLTAHKHCITIREDLS